MAKIRGAPTPTKDLVDALIKTTVTSGLSPVLSIDERTSLANSAFLDMWADIETHAKYSLTWYHTLTDTANNGFLQLTGDMRNSVASGKAIFVGNGFSTPFWVNHIKVVKFTSAEGAVAFDCLKHKLGVHITNYSATRDPEARGESRSGSAEETDYNNMVSAYNSVFTTL